MNVSPFGVRLSPQEEALRQETEVRKQEARQEGARDKCSEIRDWSSCQKSEVRNQETGIWEINMGSETGTLFRTHCRTK